MANSMIVVALTGDPELRSWVASQGLPVDDAMVGTAPSVDLLSGILAELDWPCAPAEAGGWWRANIDGRDGSYPPVSDMALHDGCLSFRLGPLFGPWEVVRRVAAVCGPQLAVEGGSGSCSVVTAGVSYEDFHQAIAGCPPPADGRDRTWSRPLSPEDRLRHGPSDLNEIRRADRHVTVEESLAYACTGRVGCGSEAMAVGHAIQAYRRDPDRDDAGRHPLLLDEARYRNVVELLRRHLADTAVPIPELVWAFGQADGVEEDLTQLADRLREDPTAAATLDMAEVFIRRTNSS
ncbi:hypothetical protein [Virgisporangium aurantiacum]|uniref:Uncharacterized protein n=1 Tax=Virgisporangium aurantiacum TaxID=175570 RepID=A0A8J3Z3J7_9ACTN|nr:hypothetical protein [Virgisporangium aurantiacum]GIJ56851.1 hypothetical protein Vau01_043670 [Virgisporangium aurantiacum]